MNEKKSTSRFRKKRDHNIEENIAAIRPSKPRFRLGFGGDDPMKAPLLVLGVLLLFMGLWIALRPVQNSPEITEDNPKSAFTIIKDHVKGLKKPVPPQKVLLSYEGNLVDVQIPRNRDGSPAVPRAVLVDADSAKILFEFNGNSPGELASVTKLMLMYYIQHLADSGVISFDDTVAVTDEAPLMGGSQAYLDRDERYTIDELLKAIAIGSANDAAYLMAQYLGSGSVITTVRKMNKLARDLGLTRTRFYNVHGLPPAKGTGKLAVEDGIIVQRYKRRDIVVATKPNIGTASDIAKLSIAYLKFDEALKWTCSRRDSVWDVDRARQGGPYMLNTHFKILGKMGIDGLKTGYTARAGWCVAATASRSGRRLVAVVLNATTQDNRDQFVEKMFDKGWEYLNLPEPSDSTTLP